MVEVTLAGMTFTPKNSAHLILNAVLWLFVLIAMAAPWLEVPGGLACARGTTPSCLAPSFPLALLVIVFLIIMEVTALDLLRARIPFVQERRDRIFLLNSAINCFLIMLSWAIAAGANSDLISVGASWLGGFAFAILAWLLSLAIPPVYWYVVRGAPDFIGGGSGGQKGGASGANIQVGAPQSFAAPPAGAVAIGSPAGMMQQQTPMQGAPMQMQGTPTPGQPMQAQQPMMGSTPMQPQQGMVVQQQPMGGYAQPPMGGAPGPAGGPQPPAGPRPPPGRPGGAGVPAHPAGVAPGPPLR